MKERPSCLRGQGQGRLKERPGGEGERGGEGECIDDGDDDRDDGELKREREGVWDPLPGFHLFGGIGGVILPLISPIIREKLYIFAWGKEDKERNPNEQ